MIQNLKIAERSILIFSKLFVWHLSGENVRMKESNWMCIYLWIKGTGNVRRKRQNEGKQLSVW